MAKQLAAPIRQRFYDANGNVLAAGKLYSYQGGSARAYKKNTYKPDQTPNSNPVVLDASGEADVWVEGGPYLFVLCDKDGNEIWARDNINNITGVGIDGANGVNGGTASNLTVGLFTGCAGQDLTSGGTKPAPAVVITSGYRIDGKGGAAYVKDAAVDAAFVTAHPGWSFRDSQGNGYRLSQDQIIRFDMFGAYGDADRNTPNSGTDDYPQWLLAKDFIQTYKAAHGNAYYKSVPALYAGRADYKLSNYIDLTEGCYSLFGYGPNAQDGGGNTAFCFNGTCGIIGQSWNTSGVLGVVTNTPKGAGDSIVQDIDVFSWGGTVGAEQHGFLMKCPMTLIRCGAYHFGGHGFYVAADVTHAGNANCGTMIGCKAQYNGLAGLTFAGGDSNAWVIVQFKANFNGTWGVDDSSFLGNEFYGYHTAGNAGTSSGPAWKGSTPLSSCHRTGHYYRVIPGQETWCKTNAPTGAATSNTGWYYYDDGSPTSLFPDWLTGTTWVAGGAFRITGASNKSGVLGGYMESDQLIGWNDSQRGMTICTGFSSFQGPSGTSLSANNGRLVANIGTGPNQGDMIDMIGTQLFFGVNLYFDRTSSETFDLRGPLGNSLSLTRNDSGHQHPFSMSFQAGMILGGTNGGYTGAATAMPSTGTYTQGAWVRNLTPVVASGKVLLGWLRLTTGSAHVANTDWTTVYGTTT